MKNKKTSILETEECKLAHVDYETKRCQSMLEMLRVLRGMPVNFQN